MYPVSQYHKTKCLQTIELQLSNKFKMTFETNIIYATFSTLYFDMDSI